MSLHVPAATQVNRDANHGDVELQIADLARALDMMDRAAMASDGVGTFRCNECAMIALYAARKLLEQLQPTDEQWKRIDESLVLMDARLARASF